MPRNSLSHMLMNCNSTELVGRRFSMYGTNLGAHSADRMPEFHTHTHTLTGNSAPSSAQVKQTDLRQLDGRHRHTLMTSNVTAVPTIKSIIETYVLMSGQRSQFHMYLFSWVCIGSCESFCLREGGKKEKEEKKKNKAIKMSIS